MIASMIRLGSKSVLEYFNRKQPDYAVLNVTRYESLLRKALEWNISSSLTGSLLRAPSVSLASWLTFFFLLSISIRFFVAFFSATPAHRENNCDDDNYN